MGDRVAILHEAGCWSSTTRRTSRRPRPTGSWRTHRLRPRAEAPGAAAGWRTSTSGRRRWPSSASRPREVRAKLDGAEVPHALLVDSERRPLGWLSDSDLRAETVPANPRQRARSDHRPRRRDAGRAGRPAPDRDAVRAGRPIATGGSPACSRSRSSRTSSARRRRRSRSTRARRATAGRMTAAVAQLAPLVGQVTIHNRTGANAPCQAQEGKVFCLQWAIDNFDRYTTPLLNQLLLVADRGCDRLCGGIRVRGPLPPPALADPDVHRRDGRPLHDPLARLHLPAAADHGARLGRRRSSSSPSTRCRSSTGTSSPGSTTCRWRARTPAAGWE